MTTTEAALNNWIKPTSGFWEEQTFWSLGGLPNATEDVEFVNAGWKALVIGTNTAQSFPQSMSVQSLHVGSPTDSFNTLLMNFSGLGQPLRTEVLTIESNSVFQMQDAALEVGFTNNNSFVLHGTFNHGDFSKVQVNGTMQIYNSKVQVSAPDPPAVYALTNGTLNVRDGISVGRFTQDGKFIQYGGEAGLGSVYVAVSGEFDIHGGRLVITNGLRIGDGDFANYARFYQYGGTVNANAVIDGQYFLHGGTITGHMQVIAVNSFQRANAYVTQTGGTNHAYSMSLGYPNRFGGAATYQLSDGVIQVDSGTTFLGGWFSQLHGLHTIASNFVMAGNFVGPGNVYADYVLTGGLLTEGGLMMQRAHFTHDGGTNLVAGDVVLGTAPLNPFEAGSARYVLGGGLLSARNITVNAENYGSFRQTGGSNQITEKLTVKGVTNGFPENYTLDGGTLMVNDIAISAGAFFDHTNGTIIHSNVLTLNQGGWHAAAGNHSLGALKLGGGPGTDSEITFRSGSSILHLANSSAQSWAAALLTVNNWHGSTSGGGATQLYFGSDTNGLTASQLAQIRFSISGQLCPARILSTGEAVPRAQFLGFSRSGNSLTLTWDLGGILQSATNVVGPYQDLSATSPYAVATSNLSRFFRLRQ